jgi:predicted flap endonuclease-1-like 5' DNA nuclease
MKVQMTKLAAGPDGVFSPGETYDLPESKARAYIAAGAAERVDNGRWATDDVPLTTIQGIGEARAGELVGIGIESIENLAAADWRRIATMIDGVGSLTAQAWVDAANELI